MELQEEVLGIVRPNSPNGRHPHIFPNFPSFEWDPAVCMNFKMESITKTLKF